MLDIKLIRENSEEVRRNLARRGDEESVSLLEKLVQCDVEWRRSLTELNKLRNELNRLTNEISDLKKKKEDSKQKIEEARGLGVEITRLEESTNTYKLEANRLLLKIPNLLHDSVPTGKSEEDNVEVRRSGEKPNFPFPTKDHIDLGLSLDIMDIERAAKISGARFYFLKNLGVLLNRALVDFALSELVKKKFVPIEPPLLMRRKPYEGVTDLGNFEEMLYKVEDEDLYLIATSEHPIAAMFMNEVLDSRDLPLKFVGISACLRKEKIAGAHGKDTKGIFRTHQFTKVEQFVFSHPEKSWEIHEELLTNCEELIRKLELPYRIVNSCTGDVAAVAAKTYDLEAWMPAQNRYREIISCSNCTDYQARRLKIRYRDKEGAPPKGFVHTLNSTAIATGRTIVSILENFQRKDGSIAIPKILRPYMNNVKKIVQH